MRPSRCVGERPACGRGRCGGGSRGGAASNRLAALMEGEAAAEEQVHVLRGATWRARDIGSVFEEKACVGVGVDVVSVVGSEGGAGREVQMGVWGGDAV